MIRNATVFRHMLDNDVCTISDVLKTRNVSMTTVDTFADSLEGFDPLGPDLLIVLGGACGVYQNNLYPFLDDELKILKARLEADKPTLGICLGAQLIAGALGYSVFKGTQGKEIGWKVIDVNEAGMRTPVRHFEKSLTPVMHWHGDTFDLPEEAVLLASTDLYPNQVFQVGRRILGFQCHIEVDRKTVRSWLVNEAYNADKGLLDLYRLQKDTDLWAGVMEKQTEKFLNEWLDQVGA
jgi:GMP synthase (glutamine-hydrolysing)